MLSYLLYALFIAACLVLVLAVLLQPGKADAGALFTSSVSSTAFGPRGTQTLLAKITIGAAISFMLLALMISMGIGGPRSVMSSSGEAAPTPQTTPQAAMTPPPQPNTSPATVPATQEGAAPAPDANTTTASPAPAASPQDAAPQQNK